MRICALLSPAERGEIPGLIAVIDILASLDSPPQ
jgi:hypothetical protein